MPSAPSSNSRLDIILLAAGTGQRFSQEALQPAKAISKITAEITDSPLPGPVFILAEMRENYSGSAAGYSK